MALTAMRHAMHKRAGRGRGKGFTLMELLVVLGIFSTVVVSATDIFLLASRSQRKVFGLERTQADARYTIEAITREVRTGSIDYGYYEGRGTPLAAPDSELALVDSTNTRIKFRKSVDGEEDLCADASSAPCLLVAVGADPPVAMTPKGVTVRQAAFYIGPLVDPLDFDVGTSTYASNVQPRVTVVLVLESTAERAGERSIVYLQTTASSRSYKR